jgi:hypothetical protein
VKTARFASIVKARGAPENYLAFKDPAKDKQFQAAVKANRVMTVFQSSIGNKSDHGEVGFHPGHSRQFLIFPKSLKSYVGSNIVGIKYDMLDDPGQVADTASKPPHARKPKKRPTPTATAPRAKQTVPSERKPAKTRGKTKPKASVRPAKPPAKAKILKFPSIKPEAKVDRLTNAMKKAMDLLEDGKTVAAFNLLKSAVNDE